MKNFKKIFFPFLVSIMICAGSISAQEQEYIPGNIIVKFNKSTSYDLSGGKGQPVLFNVPLVDQLNIRYGCISAERLINGKKNNAPAGIYLLKFKETVNIPEIINEYLNAGCFDYVEPDPVGKIEGDEIVPDDLYFYHQWSLKNDGTFPYLQAKIGADINMTQAWGITTGDTGIIAGIIDSGCKLDHPDLEGRMWVNWDEIPANGIDDDNNGFIDDINGWEFDYNTNNLDDDYWHGTFVTGIIGANGNDHFGIAGVDWNCRLMTLRTASFGASSAANAITYGVDNGARVLNMSLAYPTSPSFLESAVNYALNNDVTVVAAMGNLNAEIVYYPAGYPGVIAVGSTSPDDTRSNPFGKGYGTVDGSSFGSHISVVAPGDFIASTYLIPYDYSGYGYGTSFATPHVVGLCALLLAENDTLSPPSLKSIIENSADDLVGDPYEDTPGFDKYMGHGRINAYNALLALGDKSQGILAAKQDKLRIFPNPSKGRITLLIPDGRSAISEVIVSDEMGNSWNYPSAGTSLDLTSLASGLYFVTVISGDKNFRGKVILVN